MVGWTKALTHNCGYVFGVIASVGYIWPAERCWVLSAIQSGHLEPREMYLNLGDVQQADRDTVFANPLCCIVSTTFLKFHVARV